MATALLISTEDVKKFTVLNGNLDNDEFIQYIKITQDITIQNYLGTNLYIKFQDLITSGDISEVGNEAYLSLLTDYIKPMLIHWTMVYYLPFAAFTVGNKGVFKHTSESAQNAEKTEVMFLIEKERDIAEHYTKRFIDYICKNSTTYPEYKNNTDNNVYPDKNTNFGGWVL